MPRDIVTTVYTFEELSEEAKAKAVEVIAEKLAGPWWDSSDNDEIAEVMVYTLADKLGTPGRQEYGVGDFPGIPDVTLESWDMYRRDIAFSGTLGRENAPLLPWPDGVDVVKLDARRYHTRFEIVEFWDSENGSSTTSAEAHDLIEAIKDAIHEALLAGNETYEYKTSEEYARERCEGGEYEFLADGTLA